MQQNGGVQDGQVSTSPCLVPAGVTVPSLPDRVDNCPGRASTLATRAPSIPGSDLVTGTRTLQNDSRSEIMSFNDCKTGE